jgi:hypothetical protein
MSRLNLTVHKRPVRRSLREEDEARLKRERMLAPLTARDGIRGRKPGSQNRVPTMLKDAILIAAKELGADGKGMNGLIGWLKKMARLYPEAYLQLVARVLPLQVQTTTEVSITHKFRSEEEIKQDLARRGLYIEGSVFDVGKKS